MIYRCSGTIHKDDKAGETILAGNEQFVSTNSIQDKLHQSR